MAWSRILGHDGVIERLCESIERGRLSHAYLFVGPDGIGKELLARELAKALLCARNTREACDQCPSCQKTEHGNHPDVAFVRRAERTALSPQPPLRSRRGGAGVRGRTQIVIGQVREEIQEPIAYKAFEGRYKIFVVADAEQMTEEAQNCLLKTLEEPPPRSLLVLLATRLEPFLDTVVSRCQIVRFRPLATALVERILIEGHAVETGLARVLARLSGGSPGRALRYHREGAYDTASWLLRELGTMPPGAEFAVAAELLEKVRTADAPLEDARERVRPVLDLLALAWRDLDFRASGYAEELLTWGAGCDTLEMGGRELSARAARHLTTLALDARDRLDANANIKLLLEALLLETGAVLRGRQALAAR
jgi:DNA polymerase-3 subunit delta'